MPRQAPGQYTADTIAPANTDPSTATGQAFMVGHTQKGPSDVAVPLTSLADFQRNFGDELSTSNAWDAVDWFFRLGGTLLWFVRNIVSSTAAATLNLTGTSGTTLVGTAASKGTWGNDLRVTVVVAGGMYQTTVYSNATGEALQVYPPFTTRDELIAASASSSVMRFTAGGGTASAPDAVSLSAATGGTDSTSHDATTLETALAVFSPQLGAGQVLAPGYTSSTLHAKLIAHVATSNIKRVALLDHADGSASTAVSSAEALYTATKNDRAALLDPILTVPGQGGVTLEIPWSVVVAAHAARADAAGAPGLALAGHANGAVTDASGRPIPGARLKRRRTDAERALLSDAGVTTAIEDTVAGVPNVPITYDDRTVTPYYSADEYTELSDARIRMALDQRAGDALKPSVFAQLGGRGIAVAKANGALKPLGQDMWDADTIGHPETATTYADAYSATAVADPDNQRIVATVAAVSATSARTIQVNVARKYGGQ